MDQDLWAKALFFHGPSLLNSIVNDDDDSVQFKNTSENQNVYQFIKNHHAELFKEIPPVFNGTSSFTPLPPEIFLDCSVEQRRKLFFKSLQRGHILVLKVINTTLQDSYKLLVLAKHKSNMKIDDLSLVMYLPKLAPELQLAGGGLNQYDLLRAAVCSCSINERKLFVTLDSTILEEDAESVQLGRVSVEELPPHVGEIQIQHSSYKAYCLETSTFRNPNWAVEMCNILNIKRKYLYSFYKEWDGKTCSSEETGKYLKKKQILMTSNTHYTKAVEFYETQNFGKAIACLNNALSIYPLNKRALVSRGTLYANMNNLRKAFNDTEQALKIDPLYEPAQKQMSVLLVAAAKTHLQQNDIAAAKESLTAAIGLDQSNEDAAKALVELEKKKPVVAEISNSSNTQSETPLKSIKKKKKHHESHERLLKKHRTESRSKSPKKRKKNF